MEIFSSANLMSRARTVGEGARMAQIYPSGASAGAMLAVDLLEIEVGGSSAILQHAEEHIIFIVQGNGEIVGDGASTALLQAGSVVYVGPREAHSLRNTGSENLRALISTPLLTRSERALGIEFSPKPAPVNEPTPERPAREAESQPAEIVPKRAPEPPTQLRPTPPEPEPEQEDASLPDIAGLMKRGSDIAAAPRAERKRPMREPEPEPQEQPAEPEADDVDEAEEEEAHSALMELAMVFDGGSRGSPGQGYGSYLVQSPGRKPVIKRVEFGDNYTPGMAEYESLIACLQYIIERLTVTNRTPALVALDIKSDSDSLVNQLQGNYKVKEANLRSRHAQAVELLEQFGEWMITWHAQEESVRLLGH